MYLCLFLYRFNDFLKLQRLVKAALDFKLSCCESKNCVERTVCKLQEILGGNNELTAPVIVLVRLNIKLSVKQFYVEGALADYVDFNGKMSANTA